MKYLNSERLNIKIPKYEEVINAFIPSEIYIPLCENVKPLKIGTKVKEGDVFSTSQDISIRSSIPGSVVELKRVSMPNGKIEDVAVVKMQGAFSYEGKKNIKSEWTLFSSSKILSLLEENGVHNTCFGYENVKSLEKEIDYSKKVALGVRLYDYDPSCITDSFLFKNYFEKIIEGAFIVAKGLNLSNVYFFYSPEQSKIIKNLPSFEEFVDFNSTFIQVLNQKFSFGTKEELNSLISRKTNVTCCFVDSSTCLASYEAVALCKPVVDSYVQVSGSLLGEEKFFKIKRGTLIKNLIEECGLCKKEPYKIVINGLLKGVSISDSNTPITDYVKSITVLSLKETAEQKQRACIRCGDCFRSCPVGIKPFSLFSMYYFDIKIPEDIKKLASLCTQCGRCNTVCPSRIPLYQTISLICRQENETKV